MYKEYDYSDLVAELLNIGSVFNEITIKATDALYVDRDFYFRGYDIELMSGLDL